MKNIKRLDTNILFFTISTILSLIIVFLAVNEDRDAKGMSTISKDEENMLFNIVRIFYVIVALYFVISTFSRLIELKKINDIKEIKRQERQVMSALAVLIASLISFEIKYPEVVSVNL